MTDGVSATCHPERPRKLADGTCDRCYARKRYQSNADSRERTKAASRKSWHKRQPERSPEQARVRLDQRRARYREDPAYRRSVQSTRLERKLGVTLDDYERMLENQGGGCAICTNAPTNIKRLAVDHDHRTGQVRGLLCAGCNTGIGHLGDSSDRIRRAADYLDQF